MNDMFNIKGKTALITGSTGGLGLVMAKGMAGAGARVIINGRNKENLQRAMRHFKDEGYPVDGMAFDIRNQEQVLEEVAEVHVVLLARAGARRRLVILAAGRPGTKAAARLPTAYPSGAARGV